MARKKRRGRPPESKTNRGGGFAAKMDVVQLSSHIARLRKLLAAKIEQQRQYLERQLAELGAIKNGVRSRSV